MTRHSIPLAERVRHTAGQLIIPAAVVAVITPVVLLAGHTTEATRALACRVTGCGDTAMAVAGWLIAVTPGVLAGAGWLASKYPAGGERREQAGPRHLPPPTGVLRDLPRWAAFIIKLAFVVLLVGTAIVAISFYPGKGRHIEDLVHGPGVAGLATGLRWGALALLGVNFTISVLKLAELLRSASLVRYQLLAVAVAAPVSLAIAVLRT